MDKSKILQHLIENTQNQLCLAKEAYESTQAWKNEPDMKQEGKYDTRAIEAGQLAMAQARRVEELKLELQMLEEIPVLSYNQDDEVAVGALVEISLGNLNRWYFISSTGGGQIIPVDEKSVLVVSVFSPIGNAVLGLRVGEVFEIETGNSIRKYSVENIL